MSDELDALRTLALRLLWRNAFPPGESPPADEPELLPLMLPDGLPEIPFPDGSTLIGSLVGGTATTVVADDVAYVFHGALPAPSTRSVRNLLAHSALVTTDMGLTCFLLAGIYAFYRYTSQPSIARLLLTAIAAGLLISSKHSGILLAPITEITQRQRDPAGLTLFALVIAGLLYLLTRRIRSREKKALASNVVV